MYRKLLITTILSISLIFSAGNLSLAKGTTKKKSETADYTSLEKASAAARALLATAQPYSEEYQDFSPRTQAGIGITTGLARLANFYTQFQNTTNDKVKKYHMMHSAWAVYDTIDLIKNIIKFFGGNVMNSGAILDDLFAEETLDDDFLTKQKPASSSSLEQARKISRVLAGLIEGATTLGASFYGEKSNTKTMRIRLLTACSLARSIERSLGVETKEARVAMGLVALTNLTLFIYTCTKKFDDTRTVTQKFEDSLAEIEKVINDDDRIDSPECIEAYKKLAKLLEETKNGEKLSANAREKLLKKGIALLQKASKEAGYQELLNIYNSVGKNILAENSDLIVRLIKDNQKAIVHYVKKAPELAFLQGDLARAYLTGIINQLPQELAQILQVVLFS